MSQTESLSTHKLLFAKHFSRFSARYTNGQKERMRSIYIANFSIVNLKHSKFLT